MAENGKYPISDNPLRSSVFTLHLATQDQADIGALSTDRKAATGILPNTAATLRPAMSGRDKWIYYLKSTYGPASVGISIFISGMMQAQSSVPEWGGGMEGYGKRFGSAFSQRAINRSIRIGLNGILHEEPRYLASDRSGVWRRTFYAVGQTVLVPKDAGGMRIAFSRFAGNWGAACISRQWYPDAYQTPADCVASGFRSLGLDAAKNVFCEFWPTLKKMVHR